MYVDYIAMWCIVYSSWLSVPSNLEIYACASCILVARVRVRVRVGRRGLGGATLTT